MKSKKLIIVGIFVVVTKVESSADSPPTSRSRALRESSPPPARANRYRADRHQEVAEYDKRCLSGSMAHPLPLLPPPSAHVSPEHENKTDCNAVPATPYTSVLGLSRYCNEVVNARGERTCGNGKVFPTPHPHQAHTHRTPRAGERKSFTDPPDNLAALM